MKKKAFRRVDTKWFGSKLSDEEMWVACTNKKYWPEEGEVVEYGLGLYKVVRRELRPGEAEKYVAHLEPAYAVYGPFAASAPNYYSVAQMKDLLKRWNAGPLGDLGRGAFGTPCGAIRWEIAKASQ